MRPGANAPIMAASLAALLAGMAAGVQRAGWMPPGGTGELAAWHGPLMVAGFFGTMIGVERAVGQGLPWLYAAPVLSGLAGLLAIAGVSPSLVPLLFSAASGILLLGGLALVVAHPALFTGTMTAGLAAWLIGNMLWLLQGASPAVALWWAGFLILVIAGERLELSRVLEHGRSVQRLFMLCAGILVAGLAWAVVDLEHGSSLVALGLVALAAWLVVFDVARRTLKAAGLTRYMSACLLAGYAWLAAAGLLIILGRGLFAPYTYDAVLHAIFVGFVFSMVFAHAPVILPAVTRIAVPWRPAMYLPLALLHASLALRVAGDLAEVDLARRIGASANAFAILLFLIIIAGSAVAELVRARPRVGKETAR